MSKLCTVFVFQATHWSIIANLEAMQEGSRIYTPVRLGFPRQTLDGASYGSHKIPKGMVCQLSCDGRQFSNLH